MLINYVMWSSNLFFLHPAISRAFHSPGFSEPRFFRVQVFQGPGFSQSRFFRLQVFLSPGFSGSRFFWVQVFLGSGFSGYRFFWVQVFQGTGFPGSGSRVRVRVQSLGPGFRSSQSNIIKKQYYCINKRLKY